MGRTVQLIKNNLNKVQYLKSYTAFFYRNGLRVVKAPLVIEADSRENAEAVVKFMVVSKDNSIPENCDDWVLN
jgi:hypothetical protein